MKLDGKLMMDKQGFHCEFKTKMGFPDFAWESMDSWIDCMSYIDDENAGMSKVIIKEGETLHIEIENSKYLKENAKLYEDLVECTKHVNNRFKQTNTKTRIKLTFL